ncbi:hypothetical protein MIND_00800700 [Mycena indigotica]|uniref:Uncharacterized protein n=1 Tax=Mycena indigotica TaxID=2126181 RepID=A0A8H6SIM5_9AGAR|nr:uncharacterized protein MIND_00800700 [Mycena indigotica]KAF7298540.1 hypothetical protein MIND_00800700 [Mycena indigotica]
MSSTSPAYLNTPTSGSKHCRERDEGHGTTAGNEGPEDQEGRRIGHGPSLVAEHILLPRRHLLENNDLFIHGRPPRRLKRSPSDGRGKRRRRLVKRTYSRPDRHVIAQAIAKHEGDTAWASMSGQQRLRPAKTPRDGESYRLSNAPTKLVFTPPIRVCVFESPTTLLAHHRCIIPRFHTQQRHPS